MASTARTAETRSAPASAAAERRPLTGAPADYPEAAALFQALGAPLRLAIIEQLKDGERCVHDLVERLGENYLLTQPLVSQHLRVLRSARLVVSTRRGKENVYRLTDNNVPGIVSQMLTHVRSRS